jgi:hypothetical protein
MERSEIEQTIKSSTDSLIAALDAGNSDRLKAYLAMMGRFHKYSWRNVLLIQAQRPTATRVAGFGAWRELGRQVRHGQKAIRILAPMVYRKGDDEDDETLVGFRTACVFDVEQTDGNPLAQFAAVQGDPRSFTTRLKEYVSSKGIKLRVSDQIGSADGASAGGTILLRPGLTAAQEFSTLVHEVAHEILHQDSAEKDVPRRVRELEAEAVAFVASEAIGLETREASSDYIKLYRGDKDTLLESLERIQTTAREILNALTMEEQPPGTVGSAARSQSHQPAFGAPAT